jgi:hypothetical protein
MVIRIFTTLAEISKDMTIGTPYGPSAEDLYQKGLCISGLLD